METIQELSEYVKKPNEHDEWSVFVFAFGTRCHFAMSSKNLTEETVLEMANKVKGRLLFDYHVNVLGEDPKKFQNAKLPE